MVLVRFLPTKEAMVETLYLVVLLPQVAVVEVQTETLTEIVVVLEEEVRLTALEVPLRKATLEEMESFLTPSLLVVVEVLVLRGVTV